MNSLVNKLLIWSILTGSLSCSALSALEANPETTSSSTALPAPARTVTGVQSTYPGSVLLAREKLESLSAPDWDSMPAEILVVSPNAFTNEGLQSFSEISGETPNLCAEYGCTHILVKQFHRTQRSASVYVFCFKTSDGAYGAYSTMHHGSSTILVRGGASSEDDRNISFWKGNYFCKLNYSADEDDLSKALISALADQLSRAIGGSAPIPELITKLPVWERIGGSERLFLGSKASKRYVQLPFLDFLGLEQSKGAAFASYQYGQPNPERIRLLVIQYENAPSAQRIFQEYSAGLALSHKSLSRGVNDELFRLSDSYMLVHWHRDIVAVIAGARHKDSPLTLARQLAVY